MLGDLSVQMDEELGQQHVERRLLRLVAAQHGVVARDQLVAVGVGDKGITGRVHDGRLHRVHRGVYAIRQPPTRHGWWLAAVLACGEGAALSHGAAAALWGIRDWRSRVVDVTVPSRSGRARRRGIVIHRCQLPAADITRRERIPVTTLTRTLIDLAEVVTRRALERAVDEAERLGLLNLPALDAAIQRNPKRVGSARLKALQKTHAVGSTITKGELEELFLELCRKHALPSPEVNVPVGPYVVDFLWREQRLIVETDGHASHHTRAGFERDRSRDAWLTAAGYRVVRFTYRRIVREPATVAATVRAVLAA